MEKIFIKPVAKEIVIKGNPKDGSIDLFSYNYEADHARRRLGNLYVVGNIQTSEPEAGTDDLDVGYVINLIASLAKREYYADPDMAIKDAFAAALKKINGVVEEFFKKKDTRINVGIFTIAGGEIHISKLGKFKIILSRDGKNIDILNNVDLFNRESTQEKEFSNIISGKVHDGDRILAFYPSRSVIAREKYIKDQLLNASQEKFAAGLAAVKEGKPDFACAAVHIELKKAAESAVHPRIQPRELSEEPQLPRPDRPSVRLAKEEEPATDSGQEDTGPETPEPVKPLPQAKVAFTREEVEYPKIIPSEFALGKRRFFLARHLRWLPNINMSIKPQNRMVFMGGIATLVIIAVVILKVFVFVSPAERQLSSAAAAAESSIKEAQTRIGQNDILGARSLLVGALATITDSEAKNGTSGKADGAKTDLTKALDSLDQASDAVLSVMAEVPQDNGVPTLITASGNDLYLYLDQKESGALVKVSSGSLGASVTVKNISPTGIFGSSDYITLIDRAGKKVASLSLKKSTVGTSAFSSEPLIDFDIYQGNLYGLTGTGIIKIADAASGHTDVASWLSNGTVLTSDPSLITVDGKVYVLSTSGVLTTYYKGLKTNETNTAVGGNSDSMLLTTDSSQNFYVVDKSTARIYVLKKDSGTLVKTLKVNAAKAITGAVLGPDEIVYILSDNKVWKVQN